MGIAILLHVFIVLVLGINVRSIYVWFRNRSLAGDVAGVAALLALVSFLLFFWVSGGPDVAGGLPLTLIATLASTVLTLISLVACAIVRARARARRGSRAWISFLPVPVLALPLLLADAIAIMEFLHGH